jgi:hypothetical protein
MKKLLLTSAALMAMAGPALADTMVRKWYALDELCRGTPGADLETFRPCIARNKLTEKLEARGLCFGKGDQLHSQMEWHKSTHESLRENVEQAHQITPQIVRGSWCIADANDLTNENIQKYHFPVIYSPATPQQMLSCAQGFDVGPNGNTFTAHYNRQSEGYDCIINKAAPIRHY